MRGFTLALVVAIVVLSALADSSATVHRVVTGTVVKHEAGRSISVAVGASPRSVGMMIPVALSKTTIYQTDQASAIHPVAVKSGVRVTVEYACNAASRPGCVAEKVRVLLEATP
jgi:hypothetical protein